MQYNMRERAMEWLCTYEMIYDNWRCLDEMSDTYCIRPNDGSYRDWNSIAVVSYRYLFIYIYLLWNVLVIGNNN